MQADTRVVRSALRRWEVPKRPAPILPLLRPAPQVQPPPIIVPLAPAVDTKVFQSSGRSAKRYRRLEAEPNTFMPGDPIEIEGIWVSQPHLFRRQQIPGMIEAISRGQSLPEIALVRCLDGEFQMRDGHHRLLAYWLSGRRTLEGHQYRLAFGPESRRRYGKVGILEGLFNSA